MPLFELRLLDVRAAELSTEAMAADCLPERLHPEEDAPQGFRVLMVNAELPDQGIVVAGHSVDRGQPFDVAGVVFFQRNAIALKMERYLVPIVPDRLDKHPIVIGDLRWCSAVIGETAQALDVENDSAAAGRFALENKL
ncbi:hypothetical protein AWB91_27240 [Mycobacterium paraense]|uniref:Uncharacterized protein n=1 Tax=Mycobacterium paraense TaxID=767916 RepID=A0ABX3VHB5_9MYCO|nr:hypothetical protein AWB91_27240 [Mycobacterium paraense]ORW39348.1 hypothetical protein AWB88_16235 [Mycobacterium paraense]